MMKVDKLRLNTMGYVFFIVLEKHQHDANKFHQFINVFIYSNQMIYVDMNGPIYKFHMLQKKKLELIRGIKNAAINEMSILKLIIFF